MTDISDVLTTGPLVSLAVGRLPERAQKLVRAGVLGYSAYKVAKSLKDKYRDRITYVVQIRATDPLFDYVQEAVFYSIDSANRKSIYLATPRGNGPSFVRLDDGQAASPEAPPLGRAYDGNQAQTIKIGGHAVKVYVSKPDGPVGVLTTRMDLMSIKFSCPGVAARDAVIDWIEEINQRINAVEERSASFFLARDWGDFSRRSEVARRAFDSVVTRAGLGESVLRDLERFLDQEEMYVRLGVPYHRGYLFHGPPGCGKTSFVTALATALGMDLYYIPLSSINSDTDLLSLLSEVKPRSIVLFEDIDVLSVVRPREDGAAPPIDTQAKKTTLSGLLNALDGVGTPHGLVTILTTNHVDRLDDAVTRPGRMDMLVKFDYCDDDQVARFAQIFLGVNHSFPPLVGELAPAAIVEALKRNLGDLEGSLKAMEALIYEANDRMEVSA